MLRMWGATSDADDDFFDPGVLDDPADDDRPPPPPGSGGGDPRAGAASARYGDAEDPRVPPTTHPTDAPLQRRGVGALVPSRDLR